MRFDLTLALSYFLLLKFEILLSLSLWSSDLFWGCAHNSEE